MPNWRSHRWAFAVTVTSILTGCGPVLTSGPGPTSTPSTPFVLSVLDTGAKGDGATDDTAAFQAALDAVGADQLGGTVFVPRGTYLIKGHLNIPTNVALEGVWTIPTAWSQYKGSTLLAVEGEGNPDGPPFITLNTNSVLKGITVFYPNQVAADPPRPYPWTVASAGCDNPTILDVLLVNPWQAVDFGTRPAGRHLIRNLYGMPLFKGLYVDQCYDVGRVENVHFWPFWNPGDSEKQQTVFQFIRREATSFIFARTDWEYVTNTFSWGYRVGYHFARSKSGYTNGNFLGIGADATEISVLVDEAAPYGLLITNGEFVSFQGDNPIAIVVGENNTGAVQLNNCAFWGGPAQIARIEGIGTVTFTGCNFVDWDGKGRNQPAIEVLGGALLVTACNFGRPGTHVALHEGAEGAAIQGNRFHGPAQIQNKSKGDVQITGNISLKPPTEEPDAIVIDDGAGAPGFTTEGEWHTGIGGGDYLGMTHWAFQGDGKSKARWTPAFDQPGRYAVFVWHGNDPMNNHATNAPLTVRSVDGETTVHINQKHNCRAWNRLGEFQFEKGTSGFVQITNGADANVVADAVKFVPAD